jgi:hypothetical protein
MREEIINLAVCRNFPNKVIKEKMLKADKIILKYVEIRDKKKVDFVMGLRNKYLPWISIEEVPIRKVFNKDLVPPTPGIEIEDKFVPGTEAHEAYRQSLMPEATPEEVMEKEEFRNACWDSIFSAPEGNPGFSVRSPEEDYDCWCGGLSQDNDNTPVRKDYDGELKKAQEYYEIWELNKERS